MVDNVKEILQKPYLNVRNIAELIGCSQSKAFEIKKQIKIRMFKENKKIVDSRYLPTIEVLNYLGNDYFFKLYSRNFDKKRKED